MSHPRTWSALALATLLAAVPAQAQDWPPSARTADPGLPFVPTLFGDARTMMPDGIPSSRGAEKIGENDSPWPADRVYFNWNYYHDVHSFWDNIHRQTIGIEQTFLDGRASLGARLPFFQVNFEPGAVLPFPPGIDNSAPGDLVLLGKYALLHRPDAVLSTGLVLSVPTGPNPDLFDDVTGESVHATVVQPFVGYGKVWDNTYVHGFTSINVPTDDRDVTILFNSIGVGHWIDLGDGFVTALAPTFEVHVNNPLSYRDDFVDSVVLISGVNFVLDDRATLGLAIGPNVSEPKLFDFETQVTFNWRW